MHEHSSHFEGIVCKVLNRKRKYVVRCGQLDGSPDLHQQRGLPRLTISVRLAETKFVVSIVSGTMACSSVSLVKFTQKNETRFSFKDSKWLKNNIDLKVLSRKRRNCLIRAVAAPERRSLSSVNRSSNVGSSIDLSASTSMRAQELLELERGVCNPFSKYTPEAVMEQ